MHEAHDRLAAADGAPPAAAWAADARDVGDVPEAEAVARQDSPEVEVDPAAPPYNGSIEAAAAAGDRAAVREIFAARDATTFDDSGDAEDGEEEMPPAQ